ncbi:hypothetical protein [Endozoicomonas lisbonensis]|uniref:Uncharacterized protein n=1 Tax=Endozoicomonas lisbonensis TaxID=3120522 RepID=A0ABV2SFT4_9GAMM
MKYSTNKFCLLILSFILAALSTTPAVTYADVADNDKVLDLTDYEALFQARQAAEDNKEIQEYSFAGQFRQLKQLGLIRNENLQVNSLLIKAYVQMEDRTPQNLIQAAKALRYGIPVHEGIASAIKQQSNFAYYSLYTAMYLGTWGLFGDHRTPLFQTVYDCNASPVLLNGGGMLEYVSSSYTSDELKLQTHFMEECKMSEQMQMQIDQTGVLKDELKRLASDFDNVTLRDISLGKTELYPFLLIYDDEPSKSMAAIKSTIVNARQNEGMMFLLMFKGKRKYQFFLLGAYKEKLNLFYVADDKRPTPVTAFSMPKDVNEYTIAQAVHLMMNGKKERDRVPTLDSSVMMLNSKTASHYISWPDGNLQAEP